jgi:ribose transport system substrate-binding protein
MHLKSLLIPFTVFATASMALVGCNSSAPKESTTPPTGTTGTAGTTTAIPTTTTAANATATTSTGGTANAQPSPTGDLKITLIAKSSNNPVFLSARTGAEAAAKALSKDGRTISIDWRTPNEEDGQEQARRIAAAVNDGTSAIILSASDAAKVLGAVNDAVDKGVPVFTFDSDVAGSKRFGFYGADDEAVGKQVMDELAKLAKPGEQLNVAILAGNQNAPNLQKRVKGVEDAAKSYKNVKITGVVNHVESPQDASAAVTREMNAKPEINAWAMVGGWPLFNTSLLSLDPKRVKIVAVDALPAQLAYVDKGIAPVLLAQPVYNWGYMSVGFVVDKIDGLPVAEVNQMALIRVDKAGLKKWGAQLRDWGFTGIDPKYLP